MEKAHNLSPQLRTLHGFAAHLNPTRAGGVIPLGPTWSYFVHFSYLQMPYGDLNVYGGMGEKIDTKGTFAQSCETMGLALISQQFRIPNGVRLVLSWWGLGKKQMLTTELGRFSIQICMERSGWYCIWPRGILCRWEEVSNEFCTHLWQVVRSNKNLHSGRICPATSSQLQNFNDEWALEGDSSPSTLGRANRRGGNVDFVERVFLRAPLI